MATRLTDMAVAASAPSCPICLAAQTAPYCQKQQAYYSICNSCGLTFQHPLPSSRSMSTWADAEYTSGAYHDYVAARPMKLRHFEQRLDDIGDVVRPGRLLDVGCSCGYFTEVAAMRGFDFHGVEFSSSAIGTRRAGYPLPHLRGQAGGHAKQGAVRHRQRVRSHRACARSPGVPPAMCRFVETRRGPAHQHARHRTLSACPHGITMADAPADAALVAVFAQGARRRTPHRGV